ncbi:hypothetical protein [Mycolicibacterium sp.]|uniref:hypothetical protein n=1 Tax=Mycolicibacterium sp. TaxID=2320850 RepID=UPI001A1CD209|nr:hypothetical protein [Mycolicibacterium sp.]MBJ7339106.1 hypothetical protein [Mycolicibacterium sp.]
MKRFIAGVLGVIGAVSVVTTPFGAGVAHADALAGMTYAAASKALDGSGLTPVVATRVGSFLPQDECVVTRSQLRAVKGKPTAILLFLNCNATVATDGSPGNSAASPQGKAEKDAQAVADTLNANPEACTASEKAAADCKAFCDAHAGMCTF